MAGAFVAFAAGLLVFARQCAHTQTPDAALPPPGVLRTGQAAFGGWTTDAPGVRRHITLADLPAPYATPSVDHGAQMVPRPADAWPKAPAGFEVQQYATGLQNPRKIVTAPNGDLFIAESGAGRIHVLRGITPDGHPVQDSVFAIGPAPALRHRLLPARAEPAVGLRRRHGRRPALPLPQWRHPGARPCSRPSCRTSPAAGGCAAAATGPATSCSPKTTRSCWCPSARTPTWMRAGQTTPLEVSPGGHPGVQPGRHRVSHLRLRHPQPRRTRRGPADGHPLDLRERAGRPGGQPAAGLHHARHRGRLLRLALVLPRRPPGPAPQGRASRNWPATSPCRTF